VKTQDLLDLTRLTLRDIKKPYLWSDDELVGHLAEAEEKACRSSLLLRDFTTAEVCKLSLNTVKQGYDLDPRVIFVRRLTVATRTLPLAKASYRDFDGCEPGWIGRTGTPDKWCLDFESQKVWFNRKPTAADIATMLVVRTPLVSLSVTKLAASPEIAAPYHRPLHHWACYRAFSKSDSDAEDSDKAAFHYNAFIAEFGDEASALDEEFVRGRQGYQDMEGER
jgi:hypothetical protein